MTLFTDNEFEIMDELYFINSFEQVMKNTGLPLAQVYEALLSLLQKEFIQQLIYNELVKDFVKMDKFDITQLETASYVATKKGLLAHNSNN